ncbi:MAG: rod shape-determining protein MreC [Actinobacteria bacterium HGW-Actinobacteria-1]|jgi:rod shape-determining protein MreC|nr:MAG: rod shape-determining protein MreC [Actinobacteria bacterium HGW-Actinobacteria-1]
MRITNSEPKRANPALLIALVVVSLVIVTMYFRESDTGVLHGARKVTLAVTAPIAQAGDTIVSPFTALGDWFAGLGVSRSDIDALRAQNDELRARLAELEEARQENDRLRALVQFAEERKLTKLGARVIGRPTSAWEGVIEIDRGSADGVVRGMPVLAPQGLVGQIEEVSANSSRVRLITDQESGVAAMVQSTRAVGVVRGSIDRTLSMDFVDKANVPKVGDVVITSGLGGIYPKGLVVGDIVDVDARRADLYPRIIVVSRVPVDQLEEVLVLLGPVTGSGAGAVE